MIALDTNVLVRFLVQDDERQARRAKALVDRVARTDDRAFVSDIVLCELVWVLGRSYRFARAEIAAVLRRLVAARQLAFDSTDRVLRALTAYERGSGDFADYMLREQARSAGCSAIATFDRKLLGSELFTAP